MNTAQLGRTMLILALRQDGCCAACGDYLVVGDMPQSPRQWEQWIVSTRVALSIQGIPKKKRPARQAPDPSARLVHTHCRQHQPWASGNCLQPT